MDSVDELRGGMKGIEELRKDGYIKQWLSGAELREPTIPGYLVGIRYFCGYTGKTPQELIEEAEEELAIPMRRRKIKMYLAGFKDWLNEKSLKERGKEMAPKTTHRYTAAVRSFYTFFEIDLPKGGRKREVKNLVENNRRLTKDMVRQALKYCSVRDKAIVLTMLSSGLDDSGVCNLKIKDFEEGYDKETEITTLWIRRQKTDIDFLTFLTPEASRAIFDYLERRDRKPNLKKYHGEHKKIVMDAYEKRRVREKNGYLFINNFVPEQYIDNFDEEIRKIERTGLQSAFRYIAHKSGLDMDKEKGQWQVFRGHNLRKLFYTLLRNEGIDSFIIEFWMGHKIPEEQAAYFQAIPEKLRNIYIRYKHVLEIEPETVKTLESKEYKEIRGELDFYKEALKQRNGEMAKLMEEIEAMKAREAGREPVDDIMSRLMSDPEVQRLLKKKLEDLMSG
jgi:integrase